MKKQLAAALAVLMTTGVMAQDLVPKVIYGEDNRIDVIDSDNELFVKLAISTAAQIEKNKLRQRGAETILDFESLADGMGACPSERFAAQNSIARCSGFLVGPDLLVTAGHCIASQSDCDRYNWVFDYREGEVDDNKLPSSSVYNCKKIITQELDNSTRADYALVQLDRKVTGRDPLKFRRSGRPANGDKLVVIGHPSGLTTKIADGAEVVNSSPDQYFVADLDTYGGNSGSAVFNAESGVIEGILVRGARDYVYNYEQGCYVSNVCEQVGGVSCGGEDVSRITAFVINSDEAPAVVDEDNTTTVTAVRPVDGFFDFLRRYIRYFILPPFFWFL